LGSLTLFGFSVFEIEYMVDNSVSKNRMNSYLNLGDQSPPAFLVIAFSGFIERTCYFDLHLEILDIFSLVLLDLEQWLTL
jgi:hypothetical protein